MLGLLLNGVEVLVVSTEMKGISSFGRAVKVRAMVDDVAIFTDIGADLTVSDKVLDDFCK